MLCREVGNLQRYEQLFRIFRLCRLPPSLAVKLFRKVAKLANLIRPHDGFGKQKDAIHARGTAISPTARMLRCRGLYAVHGGKTRWCPLFQ